MMSRLQTLNMGRGSMLLKYQKLWVWFDSTNGFEYSLMISGARVQVTATLAGYAVFKNIFEVVFPSEFQFHGCYCISFAHNHFTLKIKGSPPFILYNS